MVSAYLGLPINDPRMLDLIQNEELLLFQFYWLNQIEDRRYKNLGKMLGTYWEYGDVFPPENNDNVERDRDKCIYPLALSFNSKIIDSLKKTLKPPRTTGSTDSRQVELSNINSNDFRTMVRTYVKDMESEVISDNSSPPKKE